MPQTYRHSDKGIHLQAIPTNVPSVGSNSYAVTGKDKAMVKLLLVIVYKHP